MADEAPELCVLLAWHLGRTRLQKDAVRAIEQAGGSAYYAYQYDANGNFITDIPAHSISFKVGIMCFILPRFFTIFINCECLIINIYTGDKLIGE